MSFRVHLPLERAQEFGKAAADGQMGCVMKLYRDWQLSGDDARSRAVAARAAALEFCWIPGGWDADQDGVMEGASTTRWTSSTTAPTRRWACGTSARCGRPRRWRATSATPPSPTRAATSSAAAAPGSTRNLFNGEYYEHEIRPPASADAVAPSLLVGMGADDITKPDYQLGAGCLVDQLVGQYMAHVVGLGYLVQPEQGADDAGAAFCKYNRRTDLHAHFNQLRSFALADESALLMASYPRERPAESVPVLQRGDDRLRVHRRRRHALRRADRRGAAVIRAIRARYDGRKRNPFDEAECGHHYARAMASWAAVLALSGFHYSAVTRELSLLGSPAGCSGRPATPGARASLPATRGKAGR